MKIFIIVLILMVCGCSYSVQPVSTKALNIYSAYDNKVPGKYAVILDDSIRVVNREIAPASYVCSAHRYPIAVGDTLAVSVKQTLDSVFEQVVEQRTIPSNDTLTNLGLVGSVLVKLDDFSPRLLCTQGLFSGTCSASTDISFGVTIEGRVELFSRRPLLDPERQMEMPADIVEEEPLLSVIR